MNPHDDIPKLHLPSRKQGPACLSDLVFDRLLGGDLDSATRVRVQKHLGACAACTNAFGLLSEDRAAFLARVDVPTLAAQTLARAAAEPAPGGAAVAALIRRLLLPLGLAAAAAGGFLMLAPTPGPQDGVRAKGSGSAASAFSLSTFVKHEDQGGAGTLHAGEPLHPGDKLQFRYSGAAGYLAIVAVDDKAKVSVYYPPGATAAPIVAGRDVPLTSAVELDGTLGRERIVAVLCEKAVSVDEIRGAALRAVDAARASGAAAQAFGSLGLPCAESRMDIQKTAPPR